MAEQDLDMRLRADLDLEAENSPSDKEATLWRLAMTAHDPQAAAGFVQAAATYALAQKLSEVEMTLRGMRLAP